VSWRKHLVLVLVVVFGSFGNVFMSRGMKEVGQISISNWTHIITALLNPWVASGTVLLIGFMGAYMTALSWADLTYVLPATALGYVLVALMGEFLMPMLGAPGENISGTRWAGILLITAGVGFVAGGRPHTSKRERQEIAQERSEKSEGDRGSGR
jgi:drug/metabolite transporter (DMT)-like permease